jgi:peptidoglycan/xylan/chitin deacetylase (PgdA/CDA1 family)
MPKHPFYLNFHGVGEATRPYEEGEKSYWISRTELIDVLDRLDRQRKNFRITVDDGNSSDYEIIAPELRRRGLSGTFFVLAGKLDKAGYLTRSQVRELSCEGFEIGSHGVNHVDWTAVDDEVLTRETHEAKATIEDVIERTVTAAAVPFGRYDRRVLDFLRRCGFTDVFSSDGGPRLTSAWPIPRYSIQSGFDPSMLTKRIERTGSLNSQLRTELRLRLKSSLKRSSVAFLKGSGQRMSTTD